MIELRCRPAGAAPTDITIGSGAAASLRTRAAGRRVFALVDAAIADDAALDPNWATLRLAGGETLKTLAQAEAVLRAMVAAGLDRTGLLVAVGGGAIGDLGGLCAALFLRGIECWQVPTTLMGMVDSAVGGKTAVNLPEGKNLVGCVHPPRLVLVDPVFLTTLPAREYDSGLAEALKVAIGLDAELFLFLEREAAAVRARDAAAATHVVHRALAAKVRIVETDLHEDGPRRLLNLGHTLGHALEAHARHALPHGHCVARGLHFAIDLAAARGALGAADAQRCRALLTRFGHDAFALPPTAELEPYLRRDKKVRGDRVHFVLPTRIGHSEAHTVELTAVLRELERGRTAGGD